MHEFIKQAYIHGMRVFTLSHDGKGFPYSRASIIALCVIASIISAARLTVISIQNVSQAALGAMNSGGSGELVGILLGGFIIGGCISFGMFYLAWSFSNRIGAAFILVSIFTGPIIILSAILLPGAFGLISISMALWETFAVVKVYQKSKNI